jgi:hypothetical protein
MAEDRVQEFSVGGRDFVYGDFSGIRDPGEYRAVMDRCAAVVAKYPEGSLLTIANISGAGFDSDVQRLVTKFAAGNRSFVRRTAVIGADSMKLAALKPVLMLSGRDVASFGTKEEAIAWLLEQP